MKIYGDSRSGNCLKVKYVSDCLGLDYQWEEVDVLSGITRSPEFLALNPAGQIPTVLFGEDKVLTQSNAIMRYLAHGSQLLPSDLWRQAKVDEWLFWEQYTHEPSIAVIRFQVALKGKRHEECDQDLVMKGEAALDLMTAKLQGQNYLVGNALSIADIGLFAYTQFAEEGGFSLTERPDIRAWLARVSADLSCD